jgi:hypothetical protein
MLRYIIAANGGGYEGARTELRDESTVAEASRPPWQGSLLD